jgi:hypothetical protein
MGIEFSAARWDTVRENYRRWWAGDLERPLIHIMLEGRDPGRAEPAVPFYQFTSSYDFSIPAEAVVDVWDYRLSTYRFLGDGFPGVWPNFGPGILAGFLGARVNATEETVWFSPREERGIHELEIQRDPENRWIDRIKQLCKAGMERWEGSVQVGMTDLGGAVDVLSTFRPSERLLLDLFDNPEPVQELTWQIYRHWWQSFEEIQAVLAEANPGYTAWTPIFSSEPYYMLQCDFSYMIGPEMFDRFVRPELEASCRRLGNPFYHMDGIGQIPHLDSLLAIEELKGIQWVPGDGRPDCSQWPEIYRRIRDAGKLVQVLGDMDTLDAVVEQLGDGRGLILFCTEPLCREEEIRERLQGYGVPPGLLEM